MTSRERLHVLIDELGDDEADRALQLIEELTDSVPSQRGRRTLPRFVGLGHSGQGDLGRRAKEIVRTELGRTE
jgi:hypothetical protein